MQIFCSFVMCPKPTPGCFPSRNLIVLIIILTVSKTLVQHSVDKTLKHCFPLKIEIETYYVYFDKDHFNILLTNWDGDRSFLNSRDWIFALSSQATVL